MKHDLQVLCAALLAAGVLTACGGGGGGDDSPSAPASTAVTLGGVAAKGLLNRASVSVHAVRSDGTVDPTALSSVDTGADGRYTLNFTGTAGAPYVVVVAAKADGSTTHADEVTGATQALPAGFQLRALTTLPSTGTQTSAAVNVTPFSELAVAAAAKANGGLTAANIAQAQSTVKQLLNFDPVAVVPKPIADASTPEEQALAALLTAVSQMANAGDIGCSTGDGGAKTACVVQTLGAAATTGSLQLGSGATNVSAALAGALETVLPTLPVTVPGSALAGVTKNLACSGDTCTPAQAVSGGTATAIASAKSLFDNLRSDITALFKRGGATAESPAGTFNSEAFQFQQAMRGVQVPAELLLRDTGALLKCIDFYNDYRAGRTTLTNLGSAVDKGGDV